MEFHNDIGSSRRVLILQMRLESIEAVNKIVEEANKRIQPTGTVELFGALRARLYHSNKNLIITTLTCISGLASAMGAAVEKSSKVHLIYLPSTLVFLGRKNNIGEMIRCNKKSQGYYGLFCGFVNCSRCS